MKSERVDDFARAQSAERRASVRLSSKAGHEARTSTLRADYADPDALRRLSGRIKQHTLDHLDRYLEQAETRLMSNGVSVHFASDATRARELTLEILAQRGARRVVKTKSMVTEEVELGRHLEEHGIEAVETDLGELVVQLGKETPSHIVKPIVHRNRREVARLFEEQGLGAYDDTPEVIARRARLHLREKYLRADACITGANFLSAESGRLVLVTNEGNGRFCLAATRCHVALVGIEKLVPTDRDLALFLNLLARSATGQRISVYTEFVAGPRRPEQPDGPDEMHVVFVDNGRSRVLASDCDAVLRCIRCGACLDVCPVYRQASGHAYRSVYPGPMGAVLSPLLARDGFETLGDLPRASSLCGACHEVCPVDIPLEELMLKLRDKTLRAGAAKRGAPPFGAWATVASDGAAWQAALLAGRALSRLPERLLPAAVAGFLEGHALPPYRGGEFRRWLGARGGNR